MKLSSKIIAPAIIVIFFLGIGGSIAFNLWQTQASKSAADINTPADIKGSREFSIIAEGLGIPLADMLAAFGVTGQSDIQCKELETLYGEVEGGEIGTDSVRLFASLYTGLPHTPEESTMLPMQAYDILKDKAKPEELERYKSRFVEVSPKAEAAAAEPEESHEEAAVDTTIKGKTTFEELMNWGLSKAEIEKIIGRPISAPGDTVKSLAEAQGLEFESWKTPLQELVDSKK